MLLKNPLILDKVRFTFFFIFITSIAFFTTNCFETDEDIPVYTMTQYPSTHIGYRRTILTSEKAVYENDYPEYSLEVDSALTEIVGKVKGGNKIQAIPGQNPEDYVVLIGEMNPEGIYRNIKAKPFDWRAAKYTKIRFLKTIGTQVNKLTLDSLIIEEVLKTMNSGIKSVPASFVPDTFKDVHGLFLYSEKLPGLKYCLGVYLDKTGQIYLGDNTSSREWFQAGPLFSKWIQTP